MHATVCDALQIHAAIAASTQGSPSSTYSQWRSRVEQTRFMGVIPMITFFIPCLRTYGSAAHILDLSLLVLAVV